MKKLLSLFLAFGLLLTGCSSKTSVDNTKKIGVIQLMDHTSLNLIYDSFLERIKELGYSEDQITFLNANGDMTNVETCVNQLASDQVDVAVAITTPVAMSAVKLTDSMPVIFSAVTDPVSAGLVSDLNAPTTMTGTSDAIAVDQIIDLAMQFVPEAKKVGYIYNPGEANSVANLGKLEQIAQEQGFTVETASVSSSADLQTATTVLAQKVDFIFVANDNTVAEGMPIVAQEAKKLNKLVFTGADSMVMDGGFATVGIDYASLGQETANMVDKVLTGTSISDIPVKVFDTDLYIYVNSAYATELNVAIPDDILANEKYVAID